jgi:hypothetical protein
MRAFSKRYDPQMPHALWNRAPADAPEPPDEFLGLIVDFRESLQRILGPTLAGFSLYGAAVFPRPPAWRLDVDFQVLLTEEPSESRKTAVRELHARLTRDWRLGEEMDGHYLLLDDARKRHHPDSRVGPFTDDAWALHRAHFLAGRLLVVEGRDPREIVPEPTWTELRADLREQLRYIREHPQYPAFGILNSCRILRSVRSQDVVRSKTESAAWGQVELPEWRNAIAAAARDYTGEGHARDEALLKDARPRLLAFVEAETRL